MNKVMPKRESLPPPRLTKPTRILSEQISNILHWYGKKNPQVNLPAAPPALLLWVGYLKGHYNPLTWIHPYKTAWKTKQSRAWAMFELRGPWGLRPANTRWLLRRTSLTASGISPAKREPAVAPPSFHFNTGLLSFLQLRMSGISHQGCKTLDMARAPCFTENRAHSFPPVEAGCPSGTSFGPWQSTLTPH